jgi:hypothetical protein
MCVFLYLLIVSAFSVAPSPAGELYGEETLWAAGNLWKKTQAEWAAEQQRHQKRIAAIDAAPVAAEQKDFLLRREMEDFRAHSKRLAQRRNRVQNVLINDANARVAGGSRPSSKAVDASLGTKITDPAHRGMRDVGGEFHRIHDRLRQIKEERLRIEQSAEALKIREAGKDVFALAEKKTHRKARRRRRMRNCRPFVPLRKKRGLPPAGRRCWFWEPFATSPTSATRVASWRNIKREKPSFGKFYAPEWT